MEIYTDLEKKQEPIYPFPNKDTKIFGSFSKQPGNKGCEFFNNAFKKYNINAIYKSFQVDDIKDAVKAARILKMEGFAIAMPFKMTVRLHIDNYGDLGAVNTVVRRGDSLIGYNTDIIGINKILKEIQKISRNNFTKVWIIGTGGLAYAVDAAAKGLGLEVYFLFRDKDEGFFKINGNINKLKDLKGQLIYNCTPVNFEVDSSNLLIDSKVGTIDGDRLFELQSKAQFKLYTGIDYE